MPFRGIAEYERPTEEVLSGKKCLRELTLMAVEMVVLIEHAMAFGRELADAVVVPRLLAE